MRTGKQYLAGLDDGRSVFVGDERVQNVANHAAFRNSAQTVAQIYDMLSSEENSSWTTFEADGKRHSAFYLQGRSRADLEKRLSVHQAIADLTYGMFGRSPDYFASFLTGMSMMPSIFGAFFSNIESYYKLARDRDLFIAHAVVPPQPNRHPSYYGSAAGEAPSCRVVSEDENGLTVSGMKMLATAAILADEIWIGNLVPLAADRAAEAITFALPCNAPGLSLWSRKPLELYAANPIDSPLSWRFDETDSIVILEDVRVPWERVFVHNEPVLSREIYIKTPAHVYGNHQSGVRFLSKLRLLIGVASKVAAANGCRTNPAVMEALGKLAGMEAALKGMIDGQLYSCEEWPAGYVSCNRRIVYGVMNWCCDQYPDFISILRDLIGGGALQLPADVSVLNDPQLREQFERNWAGAQLTSIERLKLFRLAWELVGSEFAGRQLQYETFYAGPTFIRRGHSYREAPWTELDGIVDALLNFRTSVVDHQLANTVS